MYGEKEYDWQEIQNAYSVGLNHQHNLQTRNPPMTPISSPHRLRTWALKFAKNTPDALVLEYAADAWQADIDKINALDQDNRLLRRHIEDMVDFARAGLDYRLDQEA